MGHQPKKLSHCFQLIFMLTVFSQLNIIYTAAISGYTSKNDGDSGLSADLYTKLTTNSVIQNPINLNPANLWLPLQDEVSFNSTDTYQLSQNLWKYSN